MASNGTVKEWTPSSWRSKPIKQQPDYDDTEDLNRTLRQLASLPGLVDPIEVETLKEQFTAVSQGKKFLLQGGDCAERFQDCNERAIAAKLKILLQMSLVITYMGRKPLVRVARLAGQYAKPRSSPIETLADGTTIPAFRGDNINSFETTNRRPDPSRLMQAYFHSAATLNYTRALISGGFASLRHPQQWNFDYIKDPTLVKEYSSVVDRILDSLNFFDTIGATSENNLSGVNIYTSHEGLLLYYEEALTRRMNQHEELGYTPTAIGSSHSSAGKYYNVGSHMLWIGDRTRQLDGAHIEYFSGIGNPMGIKVGPTTDPEELVEVVKRLNPSNETGRINLITRFGANKAADMLPVHLEAVKKANLSVLWSCDPMHGNTKLSGQLKTRLVSEISDEVIQTFAVHKKAGSVLGGVHLEMTGENVTECLGGSQQLESHELHTSYETYCDPRLNYTQSLDMAFLVAKQIQNARE